MAGSTIHYDDVYGDMYKQKAMVTRFIHRMNIRNKVIEENKELTSEREQITALDPSTGLCYINTCNVYDGTRK